VCFYSLSLELKRVLVVLLIFLTVKPVGITSDFDLWKAICVAAFLFVHLTLLVGVCSIIYPWSSNIIQEKVNRFDAWFSHECQNDARGNVGNFGGGRENRGQSSQLQGVKKSSSTDGDFYF